MSLGSGIRDPRSGINLFRFSDPGVKKAPDPDPQHCLTSYCVRIHSSVSSPTHYFLSRLFSSFSFCHSLSVVSQSFCTFALFSVILFIFCSLIFCPLLFLSLLAFLSFFTLCSFEFFLSSPVHFILPFRILLNLSSSFCPRSILTSSVSPHSVYPVTVPLILCILSLCCPVSTVSTSCYSFLSWPLAACWFLSSSSPFGPVYLCFSYFALKYVSCLIFPLCFFLT